MLARLQPAEAKKRILSALYVTEGDRDQAAQIAGVSRRTLYRLADQLDVWPEWNRVCQAKGWTRTHEATRDD